MACMAGLASLLVQSSRTATIVLLWLCLFTSFNSTAWAQDAQPAPTATPAVTTAEGDAKQIDTPAVVDVQPLAEDEDIAKRLDSILEATGWFRNSRVRVDEGVAFLEGETAEERFREWAEKLAGKTQDVVAVVNLIRVTKKSMWDITPAWNALQQLGRETIQLLPFLLIGAVIVLVFWYMAKPIVKMVRRLAARHTESTLLQDVSASVAIILTLVVGAYIALRVSGLTQLALTILGGTGLIGLALGFAFRDIAENYLASILISLNRPFRLGDLIEIEGRQGFVQRVTTRGTLLMTPGGDNVQLPNSLVYKSIVINYTANANSRADFNLGIGYDDSAQETQEAIAAILEKHPAVLSDPAPTILVDSLGTSTINLQVFFWVNVREYSKIKVKSAVIRQVKHALQAAGVSFPDEAREIIFPRGVPIHLIEGESHEARPSLASKQNGKQRSERSALPAEPSKTEAEGGLKSDADLIERQAEQSDRIDDSENLISEESR
jgi:small-conductance mechanosensitive channel